MKDTPRHRTSQARRRRCTNATLLCGAQTVSRRFVSTSPRGRRPWPSVCFESRNKQLFPPSPCIPSLIATPSYPLPSPTFSFPPSHPLILSRAKCQKTWHLTALATTLKKRRGKKAVPPSRADWRHFRSLRCTTFFLLLSSLTPL